MSLHEDVLKVVDAEAAARRTPRSVYLCELAEFLIRQTSQVRAEHKAQIDQIDGPLVGHGGSVSDLVKANGLGG